MFYDKKLVKKIIFTSDNHPNYPLMPNILTPDFIHQSGIVLLNPQKKSDAQLLMRLNDLPMLVRVDEIESQVSELIKLRNPSKLLTIEELSNQVEEFFEIHGRHDYGNWVFYPWKNTLVHVLPEEEFIKVRTIRNQYKITTAEQEKLSKKKIGIVGLSVGQSIALALVLERGCGEIRLADFDILELSNMNRIRASITDLGLKKSTIAAREILEIDPYLKVTIFEEGINEENIEDFFSNGGDLDLVVDECDSLDIKILLRQVAKKKQIPVIMDTSDRGMLDIERFDLEPEREIFHGYMGDVNYRDLKNLSMREKVTFGLKITGLETLSPRMKASLMEINQSISSWPQLASAVFLGGALGSHTARNILLDQMTDSGRFFVDLDELIQVGKENQSSRSTVDFNEIDVSIKKVNSLSRELISNYIPTKEELFKIVEMANSAPSGGNMQPWEWIFSENGVLHLFHDKKRSESLLDFKGTGSLISFGAALENIRLTCLKMGIETTIKSHIEEFGQEKIASVQFNRKSESPIPDSYSYLTSFIDSRLTNRLNETRKPLQDSTFEELTSIASDSGFKLRVYDQDEQIKRFAKINGLMDWVRMINVEGYSDFVKEIRWDSSEAEKSKDGIDLETFDLDVADLAALKIINNAKAMKFIRDHKLGQGFTRISDNTFKSASAICLLTAIEFSPNTFLNAGKTIQRMWVHANMKQVGFQPVTASLFMYHQLYKGGSGVFTPFESELITKSYKEFAKLVCKEQGEEEIFLFRLNTTQGKVVKSYRRDLLATLKIS
ncbi:Rv1355c family protein, partial [Aquiflexum sp.]|uniref:Rv1355c family protein n=1 Tax=Aquiflexum sp. TaxID=1872584 RepID=UPI0035943F5C